MADLCDSGPRLIIILEYMKVGAKMDRKMQCMPMIASGLGLGKT